MIPVVPEVRWQVCLPKRCIRADDDSFMSHANLNEAVVHLKSPTYNEVFNEHVEERMEFVCSHEFLHILLFHVAGQRAAGWIDDFDYEQERVAGLEWDPLGLPSRVKAKMLRHRGR